MGKSSGLALILVVGLAVGYYYGGNYARGRVEKSVVEVLPGLIGPAQSYRVKVDASTGQLIRKHVNVLNIHGEGVSLCKGIVVDSLDVRLKGVDFDTATSSVKHIDGAEFDASLFENNLNNYLVGVYPDIQDLKIRLMDGYCDVSARPKFAGMSALVKAQATFEIGAGRLVNARITKATTAGLPAPAALRQYFEQKINPVINTADFGFDATLKSVTVRPGSVTLSGDANLTGRLCPAPVSP
jgi:hypothetical protein